jgi:FkbM family methyltransferase
MIQKLKKRLIQIIFGKSREDKIISQLKTLPRYAPGSIKLQTKTFKYTDAASVLFIYKEIFRRGIYEFNSSNPTPTIIDAGANVGLATIYFKQRFPNAKIIAFEPDQKVFNVLSENIEAFNFQDVYLINKALWNKEGTFNFVSEGADSGRIADLEGAQPITVTSLRQYLKEPIDLLKLDIEGAEYEVLQDCEDLLKNVQRIFVEYHSFQSSEQRLPELTMILKNAGFRLLINVAGLTSPKPFTQINKYMDMDMQLNVYGYRT